MRQVINYNFKWCFTKHTNQIPLSLPLDWNIVNLPHTYNNIDGQDGGNDYYRGKVLYTKQIFKHALSKDIENKKIFLEINGANSSSKVYVDNNFLYEHHGGYSTYRIDITNYLKDESLITIEVDNLKNDFVYPQQADFTFYGGLYRDVNLIIVEKSHFDLEYYGSNAIKVTPIINDKDANVEIEVYLKDASNTQSLTYTLKDNSDKILAFKTVDALDTKINFEIKDVHLWNGVIDPYLYKIEVALSEKDKQLDCIETYFGCRTFKIDPNEGFILNGNSYPLHGVSRHQDRWLIGNALEKHHHKQDIKLILEAGFNTIRLAHYQHDKYFYELCDKYGLVVWAEIPYISNHMNNGLDNTISQMKELIIQNYNHPSIVVWGLSNEITMSNDSSKELIDNHNILNDLCHKLDKTRCTTLAAISMCNTNDPYLQIPDCIAYNHYFGWYGGNVEENGPWLDDFHNKYPSRAIGLSEYGCEGLNWHTSNPKQGDYTEEYQAYYHEEMIKQLFTRKYLWSTYVWNMFDFGCDGRNEGGENGQNHKGLVTFDRSYKKDSFYAYKAWLSKEAFIHICSKRYVDRVEPITKIKVYSNLEEVELFANGISVGVKKSKDHFFEFEVENCDTTYIKAISGNCYDEAMIKKVDTFNKDYRLQEVGAILNWFDIKEVEGHFCLNDSIKDILDNKEGKHIIYNALHKIFSSKKIDSSINLDLNENLFKMIKDFTVIRLINMMSVMGGSATKEELLDLNDKLNKIKK